MVERLVSFIGLVAVLTAIPGPSIVLIMKSSLLGGRRRGLATALGVFSGDLVWVTASLAGLTALLAASRPAFEALQYLGAAYLAYLGLRLLLRRGHEDVDPPDDDAPLRRGHHQAFGQGVLSELSNPKTLVVFTSVIPPFLPHDGGALDLALFGVVFASVGLGACTAYALVLGTTRRVVRRPRLADALLRASGALLVLFGSGLAVEGVRGD